MKPVIRVVLILCLGILDAFLIRHKALFKGVSIKKGLETFCS